jgi:hypothetical protein
MALENKDEMPAYAMVRDMIEGNMRESGQRLARLLEAKVKAELAAETAEPMLPVSAGRFLSEPVVRTGPSG